MEPRQHGGGQGARDELQVERLGLRALIRAKQQRHWRSERVEMIAVQGEPDTSACRPRCGLDGRQVGPKGVVSVAQLGRRRAVDLARCIVVQWLQINGATAGRALPRVQVGGVEGGWARRRGGARPGWWHGARRARVGEQEDPARSGGFAAGGRACRA